MIHTLLILLALVAAMVAIVEPFPRVRMLAVAFSLFLLDMLISAL